MQVKRITTHQQWQEHAEAWNILASPSPFMRFEWLSAWWKHYGEDRELYILAVTNNTGTPLGFAPFIRSWHPAAGHVIEVLGAEYACSDYMGLMAKPENQQVVANAVADWMLRESVTRTYLLDEQDTAGTECSSYWDLLKLDGITSDNLGISLMAQRLQQGNSQVEAIKAPSCWRIELPETWEEYLSLLSKSHRKQVRRCERRFFDTGRATFHTAENPAALAYGMELLKYLHQQRWENRGEAGCFADHRFFDFLTEAGLRLYNSDRHRMHWVELDKQPVAVEYHLMDNNVIYAYQAGVSPEVLDEEPGRLFNIGALKQAIQTGRSAFDFVRGDEPYKPHWRAVPQECQQLRIVPPVTSAWLRNAVWTTGRNMRNWLRGGLKNTEHKQHTPTEDSCR